MRSDRRLSVDVERDFPTRGIAQGRSGESAVRMQDYDYVAVVGLS